MIAVDTNILIYAHRKDSIWHANARACVTRLAEGKSAWAIPWPCIHEFLAIVTHPRIYNPPTPLALALDQVEAWFESPSLTMLGESNDHWDYLKRLATNAKISGPQFHDARIAVLCMAHGVSELWTADRDFSRYSALKARNPLVA
ncbi:MAG: type II toxin-antitoxin system VapC family toxin [Aestuariivirga sp.]